jgi:predicted DNA-binding transcriptional regulator AlpA
MIFSPADDVPAQAAALLDVQALAKICHCSTRHIYRMADAGRCPRPVKLGALVRWRRSEIEAWIAGGCKPIRTPGTKGGGA